MVPRKTVGEFACADAQKLYGRPLAEVAHLIKNFFFIHENSRERLVEVRLQIAVRAIVGAVREHVDNVVVAAQHVVRARALLDGDSGLRGEVQNSFSERYGGISRRGQGS